MKNIIVTILLCLVCWTSGFFIARIGMDCKINSQKNTVEWIGLQTEEPNFQLEEPQAEIQVKTATFVIHDVYGRLGQGSRFYSLENAVKGYQVMLVKDGVVMQKEFCLEEEIEKASDLMLYTASETDSICDKYYLMYYKEF